MAKPHVVRSGALTRVRVEQIVGWVEKLPNDLPKVARACLIYPADLLYWFALGQTYDCPQPLAAELAWRVNVIRAKKASVNQKRIERGARGGKKVKQVTDANGDVETTVEDVLPAQWAIERLEQQAAESNWELSPNDVLAKELVHAFESSKDVPQLTEGEIEQQPPSIAPGDGPAEEVYPGPESAPNLPGGPEAR